MKKHPELGFGIMRMPQQNGEIDWTKSKNLIDEYMKEDFCYFDTHPSYMMGKSQRLIKEFVVKRYDRQRFFLANKMPYYDLKSYKDYSEVFYSELAECGVEYFDYYLLHAISKDVYGMHDRLGGFHFLQELKRTGKVKKIGFSFHDDAELLKKILESHPEVDFVQLQINYLDWENPLIQSRACYDTARKYGKPIIVMEPVKGGSLARGENSREYARMALQFVKHLPGIQIILSGMAETEHIRENRITLSQEIKIISEAVYEDFRVKFRKQNVIPCTECRYCVRECPQAIQIPDIFSLVNTYYRPGIYDKTIYGRMRTLYKTQISNNSTAGKCISCGKCEQRCPQKISIRENLRKAVDLFEKEQIQIEKRENKTILPERFKNLSEKEIILWGCGHCFLRNISNIEQYSQVRYVCDNNPEKWNKEILPGIVCISPDELRKKKDIFIVIMLEDAKRGFDIVQQLLLMGIIYFDIVERWMKYASEMKWKN